MIVAAAVLWGLIGPFSVWAGREGLTPSQIAFWRTALSAGPFAVLAATRWVRPTARDLLGIGFFGAFGVAVMYAAFFIAVERVGVGVAAVLLYTGPAWVAVFQWLATRHAPTRVSVIALVLTLLGIVALSVDPADLRGTDHFGVAVGILSGCAYSMHYTVGRHYIARVNAPVVYLIAMTVAALVLAPVARPGVPPVAAAVPLLFLSVIATFIASLLFARGVVEVAPVRAAITATIEPVVATVASLVVLHETMGAQQLAGAALVLTGVTLIIVRGMERE